jgi:hypothetical protein
MKKFVLSLLLVGSTLFAMAANNGNQSENTTAGKAVVTELSGKIIDMHTNETLVGVKVTLKGTDKIAYTDFDGMYRFDNLQPGTYNLTASYISYDNKTVEHIVLTPKAKEIDLSLKKSNE